MSEIAANSSVATLKELDLFKTPQTQGTVEKIRFVDKRTITSDPNASPLEFQIPESGQDFIDLKRSMVEIKFKVKNGKNDLVGTDKVAPINYFLHSLLWHLYPTIF